MCGGDNKCWEPIFTFTDRSEHISNTVKAEISIIFQSHNNKYIIRKNNVFSLQ